MTDDDIRRALARYADTTPHLDPRAGLGGRLAARARRQRLVVAGTAATALVVAGTGVAALGRDGDRTSLTTRPAASASAPTRPAPTATPAMPPVSVPPTPAATRSAEPSREPSPEPTATMPTAAPGAPVTVTARGSDGLVVVATLTPGDPATATEATLTVRATDDAGRPVVQNPDWGDGSPARGYRPPDSCGEPADAERTFRHAWRHPGPVVVAVRVGSPACDAVDADAPDESVTVRLPFDVQPGKATTNGPDVPDGAGLVVRYDAEDGASVEGVAVDADGHLSWGVDWGDGGYRPVQPNGPCDDGDGRRYPATDAPVHAYHGYAAPGTYTVTITLVSTGCGGADEQRTVIRHTVEVPEDGAAS